MYNKVNEGSALVCTILSGKIEFVFLFFICKLLNYSFLYIEKISVLGSSPIKEVRYLKLTTQVALVHSYLNR